MGNGQIKPGEVRNPGGRTKADIELEAFARLNAKAALDVLVKEMKSAPLSSDRITAANRVLERAYGKPKEHVTVAQDRSVESMTDDELIVVARQASAPKENGAVH